MLHSSFGKKKSSVGRWGLEVQCTSSSALRSERTHSRFVQKAIEGSIELENGNVSVVRVLLEAGANFNPVCNRSGEALLFFAVHMALTINSFSSCIGIISPIPDHNPLQFFSLLPS